jgi:hypothetical protein
VSKFSEPFTISKASVADANAAMEPFFDLFPDRYPFVVSEDDHAWRIGLKWPDNNRWYVDPTLTKMARASFGLSLNQLPSYWEQRTIGTIPLMFSMFHSRALLTPAMALRAGHASGFSHIVHVDDHDDLMPPLLRRFEKGLLNPLDQSIVNLANIDSINTAIDAGVISKGSFLAAYVLANPAASVIHVREDGVARFWGLSIQSVDRTIVSRTFNTSFVFMENIPAEAGWLWQETPILPLELRDCESVWLDVDLDAFCNRYDGDSNRMNAVATNAERALLRDRINVFLDRLSAASWRWHIRAVSVAASPGFFPSEYWKEAIPKVTDGIAHVLGKSQ